jgi:hypothetical protein
MAGNGICGGRYPVLTSVDSPAIVYQSCIEVDDLNTTMEGYYTFRYLLPDEEPNTNPEHAHDIDPSLLFRVHVNPL